MLIPNGTHIMVLDGAKRVLYRNDGEAIEPDLVRIADTSHHSAETHDQGTERPGRRFESAGSSRGAYENSDYHQRDEDDFAVKSADILNALATDERHKLILVAAPRVLGVMRQHMTAETKRQLLAEIDKDYAGRSAHDVAEMLVQHVA